MPDKHTKTTCEKMKHMYSDNILWYVIKSQQLT